MGWWSRYIDTDIVITDTNDDNDQVLPDDMISIRRSLHNMESHTIGCGPAGAAQPDEVVRITWVDEDKAVNIGWVICFIWWNNYITCGFSIKSVIDGRAMDGVTSYRIHSGPDMTQGRCLIRWTEVFLISTQHPNSPNSGRKNIYSTFICIIIVYLFCANVFDVF